MGHKQSDEHVIFEIIAKYNFDYEEIFGCLSG